MALFEFVAGTPKYWKQYLDYLDQQYEEALEKWANESVAKMAEYEARPWYQKIMQSADDIDMYNQWDKPEKHYERYQPTVVDYYNWDVNVRQKGANLE